MNELQAVGRWPMSNSDQPAGVFSVVHGILPFTLYILVSRRVFFFGSILITTGSVLQSASVNIAIFVMS
ncbi:hypothetical protein V1512DRAFT_266023 [Lipomyces arxii]|uniref:uncharacterized protein n=1 Tax=Lipomyces arxii TaxID=56418 RepID=UPI0034D017C3